MNETIRWAARLDHVEEVSLAGVADLAYWQERLRPDELVPRPDPHGRAQLLVIAAAARFMGLAFREVSFSVVVDPPAGAERPDASFLLRAFNSRRSFAWCERAFFKTPYYHGHICEFSTAPPVVDLVAPREGKFRLAMGTDSNGARRTPTRTGEDGWRGPVYLPTPQHGPGPRKMFFAELHGHTEAYPFNKDADAVTISPGPDHNTLRELLESSFSATEWLIRTDAFHAKSKTYKRIGVDP
jgi:hypothetical protein